MQRCDLYLNKMMRVVANLTRIPQSTCPVAPPVLAGSLAFVCNVCVQHSTSCSRARRLAESLAALAMLAPTLTLFCIFLAPLSLSSSGPGSHRRPMILARASTLDQVSLVAVVLQVAAVGGV